MSMIKNDPIVVVAAKRTPYGAFGKSLINHTATDLAEITAQECLKQSGLQAEEIESSSYGNVVQTSKDAAYLARHVALRVGMKQSTSALTLNRLCGSGFEAIAQGAYRLLFEGEKCVLVGGTESMSQAPFVSRTARFGTRLGNAEFEDVLMASLTDQYTGLPMAITAENLAVQFSLSREEVDQVALRSQQRATEAWKKNVFKDEVSPVILKSKKGDVEFSQDEHIRPETTMEALAKLPPVFKKDGVVTAGNASGICDGAASLILTRQSWAQERGLKVLGTILSWAAVGCDPKIMGYGPVPATHKALENYKNHFGSTLSVSDFDLVEINEAFAAQYLAVEKELKLNPEKTNVHGGAIAIGHPLASSGARLTFHLLYALAQKGGGLGLASACIGGGQGMSVLVKVE